MINIENLNIKEAKTFKERLFGLMFKKNIDYGLMFDNCRSIHTFFMKEEIDVIATDKSDNIIEIQKKLKPWKILIFNRKVKRIYELPKNTLK